MKLIYIAGKYSAPTPYLIKQNIEDAWRAGLIVAQCAPEWFPVIPHKNTEFMDGLRPYEYFINGTLELLRRCDAILMLSGWAESAGAKAEREEARRLGLTVFNGLPDFICREGNTNAKQKP